MQLHAENNQKSKKTQYWQAGARTFKPGAKRQQSV